MLKSSFTTINLKLHAYLLLILSSQEPDKLLKISARNIG